jgi:hypothetical protein
MTREMRLFEDRVYGVKVSRHGLEHGRMDYHTLAKILGDVIHNDIIREETPYEWEIVNGEYDEDIMQEYIISEYGYKFLADYTDEIVFYNETLDLYIWGVTHIGTSWDYVLTDIKLIPDEDGE